jgi:HSP20 family molecular chaperone IbpA
MQKQIEQLMKARAQMLKSLFDDSDFQDFDKHFENMFKNFDKSHFDSDSMMGGNVVGEYDWRETDTHQIFVLKVTQVKDKPLDIKIEKGHILLSGQVESVEENKGKKSKRISKVHFERSFSIPEGVDLKNLDFENGKGEFLIKFKKLAPSKIKNQTPKKEQPSDERRPIGIDESDVTI